MSTNNNKIYREKFSEKRDKLIKSIHFKHKVRNRVQNREFVLNK